MEGFYTLRQTANVLGLSTRMVQKYAETGHLTPLYQGRLSYYEPQQVHALFDRIRAGRALGPGSEEFADLRNRVEQMEHEVQTLKLGLGFGAKHHAPREVPVLLMLRQKFLTLLAHDEWTNKEISNIADDLIGVQRPELLLLYDRVGVTAWLPLDTLSEKMLVYLERHPSFPEKGLGTLHARLIRARDRFFGLIYTTSRLPVTPEKKAVNMLKALARPGAIDSHILAYIYAER